MKVEIIFAIFFVVIYLLQAFASYDDSMGGTL